MTHIKPELIRKGVGGAQPNISGQILKDLKIPLPSLEEQKRIAAILDKADAIRQKRREAIAQCDEFLKSTFLHMFGDPVTNPKAWEVKKLGEHIKYLGDIGSNGSNQTVAANLVMSDTKDYAIMIRTTNLTANNFTNKMKYVSKKTYEFFSKSQIFGGEIIMNKIGSAGDFWLMPDLGQPVSLGLNQFVNRFNDLNTKYIYSYLSTPFSKANIKNELRGVATKSITKTAVKELPLLYPPLDLQNKFADIAQKTEATKARMQASLQELDDNFNALMQQAFKREL